MSLSVKKLTLVSSYAFALFILMNACGNSPVDQAATTADKATCTCITAVIAADEVAGKTRNHACERQSLSLTIVDYERAIRNFDYRDCPDEFSQAMFLHADAWKVLLPIVQQFPNMRGEMHDLFSELKSGPGGEEFSLLVDEVWATWADVEEARKICTTR
jgi:hypothetical protein